MAILTPIDLMELSMNTADRTLGQQNQCMPSIALPGPVGGLSVSRFQERVMNTNQTSYSIGTKFAAMGHVWTLVSCGNGRYGFTADNDTRESPITFTMPCRELHAAIDSGDAVLAS